VGRPIVINGEFGADSLNRFTLELSFLINK